MKLSIAAAGLIAFLLLFSACNRNETVPDKQGGSPPRYLGPLPIAGPQSSNAAEPSPATVPDASAQSRNETGQSIPESRAVPEPQTFSAPLPSAQPQAGSSAIPAAPSQEPVPETSPPDSLSSSPLEEEAPLYREQPAPSVSTVAQDVLSLINQTRLSMELAPLQADSRLEQAAGIRSRELLEHNYLGHTRPGGQSWLTVLEQDVPYAATAYGENLAQAQRSFATPSPSGAYWYDLWADSPGHYANMINPHYSHVGIAIAQGSQNGQAVYYAVTVFAAS